MRMVLIIFRKELTDALRDRRTLMTMVFLPLLVFPLVIGIASKTIKSQAAKAQERTLKVAMVTNGGAADLWSALKGRDDIRLMEDMSEDEARALVAVDSLDALIVVAPGFDADVAALRPGAITLYFKSAAGRSIEKRRVTDIMDEFEDRLLSARMQSLDLDKSVIETVDVTERNLATTKERFAEEVGGFLPYMFIIFCFTGSMYAAIDLAAGEKERGTLETLFTSPASRFSIVIGKFGVVVMTGVVAAVMSLVGMYVGIRMDPEIPRELMSMVLTILEPGSIALLLSMLLPLTVFFAAVLLSVSIFAKSFKEAQSFINPLMLAVFVPAFIGLLPGMELNPKTALVPILNVSLATKEIIADTIRPLDLAIVYLSLVAFAVGGLAACTKIFERESTVFRGM